MVAGAGQEDYVTEEIVNKYHFGKVRAVVSGGKERYDSVWNGLKAVRDGMAGEEAKEGYVYIHDGARPFVDEEIIKRAYTCVEENRACVAGMPSKDTVKIVDENQLLHLHANTYGMFRPRRYSRQLLLHRRMRS